MEPGSQQRIDDAATSAIRAFSELVNEACMREQAISSDIVEGYRIFLKSVRLVASYGDEWPAGHLALGLGRRLPTAEGE